MLAKGGNAVDAAVATAIALTVVEPVITASAATPSPSSGTAEAARPECLRPLACRLDPGSLHRGRRCRTRAGIPPPCPAQFQPGWSSQKFGQLPFADLFEPAIRYASDGFLVSPTIAQIWGSQVERLGGQPGFARRSCRSGRAPTAGEHFRPPDHANTLAKDRRDSGGEDFYRGEIAETIARRRQRTAA